MDLGALDLMHLGARSSCIWVLDPHASGLDPHVSGLNPMCLDGDSPCVWTVFPHVFGR